MGGGGRWEDEEDGRRRRIAGRVSDGNAQEDRTRARGGTSEPGGSLLVEALEPVVQVLHPGTTRAPSVPDAPPVQQTWYQSCPLSAK
eukprot:3734162-Rhodomonas_salina.1